MTPEEKEFDDALAGAEAEFGAAVEKPSQVLTERDDGVKVMALKKVAPDLSEAIPTPPESETPQGPTTTDAAMLGLGSGMSLGFADELFGALTADSDRHEAMRRAADDVELANATGRFDPSAAAPPIPGITSYTLKRPGQPDVTKTARAETATDAPREPMTWEELYKRNRDLLREDEKKAAEAHPVAYHGGEFVGGMLSPVPAPGKAKGLAKIGKYALQGAGVGAAAGLGHSEADDYLGLLKDTGIGGGAGGVLGGLFGAVSSKLDPMLERAARRKAYKALDPYMASLERNLKGKLGREPSPAEMMDELERLGARVLDEDIIPKGPLARFSSSEQLGNRAAAAKAEAGAAKGGFEKMLEEQLGGKPVSLGRMAAELEDEARKASLNPAQQRLSKQLAREASDMRQSIVNRASEGMADPAAMSLSEAEALKTLLQRDAYKMARANKVGPRQQAKEIVARIAKEHPERLIESSLGPEDLAQFQALKGRYGDLADIADTAAHGAIRDFRNQSVSMGDRLAAITGSNLGSSTPEKLAASVAAGALNKLGRQRGAAAMARTLSNRAQTSSLLNPTVAQMAGLLADDDGPPPDWLEMVRERQP